MLATFRLRAPRYTSSLLREMEQAGKPRHTSVSVLVLDLAIPLLIFCAVVVMSAGLDRALLGVLSIVGSIIVAAAVFLTNRTQDRIKTTLDMHRDYYSPEIGERREEAIKFFRFHFAADWLNDDPYDVPDPENTRAGYSEVLRFFHRLAILYENGRLDNGMTVDLFSREIGFWWGFAFCRMKQRANWWTGPMVYRLARRLAENGGWTNFRRGYRSGRKLRLHGDVRQKNWLGQVKRRPRSKSKAPQPKWFPATEHWL